MPPPNDTTGAAPAAATATIEQPAALPQAAVIDSGAAAAAPAVADTPSTTEAPAAVPEPAAPALVPHTDTPSLLATAANEAPTDAAKPAAEAVKEQIPAVSVRPEKPGTEPVPGVTEPVKEPVTFEAFTLPEGVTLAEDGVKEFTATLTDPELVPQARAQALLDMHVGAMQRYAEGVAAEQHRAFGEVRQGWRTQVMADEELGGAGHQTAMNAIARMRDLFVPAARREAFNKAMDDTGAGDHPEILRVFYAAARLFDEPAPLRDPGRPPPNNQRRPGASHGGFYDQVDSGRQGPPPPR